MAWFIKDPKYFSLEKLKEVLDFNASTGEFTWKVTINKHARKGKVAGGLNSDGYRRIRVFQRKVFAHRLAWFYVYGLWPTLELDHIDRNRDNNSILNLRETTHVQNCQGTQRKLSKSGFKGVHEHPQKVDKERRWVAKKGRHYIGIFSSPQEAHTAYLNFVSCNKGI